MVYKIVADSFLWQYSSFSGENSFLLDKIEGFLEKAKRSIEDRESGYKKKANGI
ncbi:MAG: hypothetical protein QW483_00605 [Nanopusillaceae archaeon]